MPWGPPIIYKPGEEIPPGVMTMGCVNGNRRVVPDNGCRHIEPFMLAGCPLCSTKDCCGVLKWEKCDCKFCRVVVGKSKGGRAKLCDQLIIDGRCYRCKERWDKARKPTFELTEEQHNRLFHYQGSTPIPQTEKPKPKTKTKKAKK